jgi:hypothetical protein
MGFSHISWTFPVQPQGSSQEIWHF